MKNKHIKAIDVEKLLWKEGYYIHPCSNPLFSDSPLLPNFHNNHISFIVNQSSNSYIEKSLNSNTKLLTSNQLWNKNKNNQLYDVCPISKIIIPPSTLSTSTKAPRFVSKLNHTHKDVWCATTNTRKRLRKNSKKREKERDSR